MKAKKIVNIGIMPFENYKRYTMAIASGKYKPGKNEPKIWFESIETCMQVLSTKNVALLKLISKQNPESIQNLAEISGRKKSNLSRTLKTFQRYKLVDLIEKDRKKKPKVLLCGSIFGGTGASGLPTIARLITNKLSDLNIRERVRVGSIFILPYFGFTSPAGESENGIYAQSDKFLLNTEAALRYYVTQAQGIFDTVYLLGNENLAKVQFSIGKNTQRNQPHFIELYAGLAARHFLTENHPDEETIVLLSRTQSKYINWDDIPDGKQVHKVLGTTTRFAYTWLAIIAPELANVKQTGLDRSLLPWVKRFYPPKDAQYVFDSDVQQNAIAIINNWCKDYLRWLKDIHECDSDRVELFKASTFAQIDRLQGTKLQELIVGDIRDAKTKQRNDEPTRIKNNLDPRKITGKPKGTVGLAQAVYKACQL